MSAIPEMTPTRLEEIKLALEEVRGRAMTQDQCDMQDELYLAISHTLEPQVPAAPLKFLYLLRRPDRASHDTYRQAVVCASSEAEARLIHPGTTERYPRTYNEETLCWEYKHQRFDEGTWIHPPQVIVTPIGVAAEETRCGSVIVADFWEA